MVNPTNVPQIAAALAGGGIENIGTLNGCAVGVSRMTSHIQWERHPAGDELVACLDGEMTLIQEVDGAEHAIDLSPGHYAVNPAGVWHTADIADSCRFVAITAGLGTEHRPR